jgi:hypothetical protein
MFQKALNLLNNLFTNNSHEPPVFKSAKTEKLVEYAASNENPQWYALRLKDFEAGEDVLAAEPSEQLTVVLDLIEALLSYEDFIKEKRRNQQPYTYTYSWILLRMLVELLRKKLPFTENELLQLIDWSSSYELNHWRAIPQIIKQLQDFEKTHGFTPSLVAKIKTYIEVVSRGNYQDAQDRQNINKLYEIAGLSSRIPLIEGEAWTDFVLNQITRENEPAKSSWIELLNHCAAAKGSTPTAKWLKTADTIIEKIGRDAFKQAILEWFPLVDKPRTQTIERWSEWSPDPNLLLNDQNADILKGLVWLCTKSEDREIVRAITALAISTYRKVPKVGQRCVRVGNACVWALGEMMGDDAVGQLALLKVRIKFGTAQKLIETALEKAAVRAKLPKEEIEEMSVPNYGLQEVGKLREIIGEYSAEISIKGTDEVNLQWFNAEGKLLKSAPLIVKKDYGEELKELNQTLKDIRQMLPAQRNRIDCLYLEQKQWDFDVWRERYLDHTLIGTLARRLIWKFTADSDCNNSVSGIWLDGKIVSSDGKEIVFSISNTKVELWHPLDEPIDGVLAWREFLEQHLIRQPFKQAHREVYLLTDAERNTRVYSNRYAAHILKQHQFNALCAARGWKNKLRLMVDADFPPAMRMLAKWNLRGEFWVEGIGENYGTDTNETGTYLYLATDQVRFYPIDARENYAHAGGGGYGTNGWGNGNVADSLDLEQIPPLVFSEIMRDVDLFVGVASVGNDPNWLDSGAEGNRGNYWYDYSFGELSVSAKTRKQMLERLIPRLKIAPRCSFDDKFLVVKGDFRAYKIHLGSGNILMKPNDQYLCIVANQGTADSNKVFLPFEGDQRTAVILSKAFLLADDTKIKDETILRQIK